MDKLKKACETKRRTLESVIAEADGELGKQEPSLEMLMSLRPKLLRCKDRFLIASDCLIEQLIKADREDEEIEDVDIVQANLFGRSEGVLQKMEQLLAKPTVDRESIVSGGNEGKSNLHRLPKLELPKFGGEAREWLQFWSAFQSVHDDDSISACVKFQYLQNCMIKGSVSEEIVSSFPNSAANYPLAISTLKERFGREDMLVEVYVRDLIAITLENAHGRNNTSFSTVYVRLSSQLRALGSLGVTTDKCAAILYPMVESALPEDLFVAWERTRHHYKPDEDGKHKSSEVLLEKLMEFLKHEVEGSERMRLARQPFSSSYPSQFNRDKPPKPKTSVATAASLVVADGKSNNAYKCVFCDEKHLSEQCCKAMSMSLEERRKIIQEKQCCYSCLKPGHFSKYCRNVVKCVICSKKHRAILCPVSKGSQKSDGIEERSKNINASVDMSNQIRCQDVLLQTIMVKINGENKSKVVRAMLDSGSQNSYVLEQTASEVGLTMLGKKEVVHLLFGGVKSRPQQHKRYRIYISDVDSKYNCNFEVQDCSTICSAMPSAQPTEWMTELRSKGIDLDVYRSNTEIELLLGADVYAKLLTGKKIELESGPVALETKLGWTVSGKVLGNVQTTKSQSSVLSCLVRDATIQDLRRLDVISIMEPMKEKSKEELSVAALEHFNQTVKQNEDGRYSVNLPWIGEHPPLPNYKLISEKKLESTTALAGIKRDMNWSVFVAGRVKKIRQNSSITDWRHVPGKENPADIPSRGASISQLITTRWWERPVRLKKEEQFWTQSAEKESIEEVNSELRKAVVTPFNRKRKKKKNRGRRISWPLGKVEEVLPGADGQVRVARVKTSSGVFLRPVQRLFPQKFGNMEEMDALKKRRKAIRGTFTRIINEINGEFEKSQIDKNDIYSKFNRLESYYTKLVDLNEKYQALLVVKEGITEESIDREWQECDKYEEEKFDIQQKVSVLRNPDKEETIPIASEDTVIDVKLPELALKSYDGSLECWLSWWAQFSKIHENKNLSDSDRFLYLRQAIVPNSEAYRVVASYPVTGANYVLAVQALQERFGDPNILTELYVRRLLNSVITNVKKENRNLSSLYDELSSHLRSLETLGIDPQLSGIFLYPLVESSLPSDILKIWHRHPSSGYGMELAKREESDKGVGGAQERLRLLLDFLKAEVRSAQRLKFVEKGFKQEEPYKRSYNDGTRTRSNFRPATVSSLFGGRTNIKCFFCERTNHASHQCRSIMKMSPGERNDKIRSAHLCFKCLRKGHIQSQCREQLECKNCGRNHLEVLCEGNSSNRLTKPGRENLKENATEPIASLSSQACTGQVLLMTTVALLRGPNASRRVRILLDSGSQFSYIKQSLVWSIGIERKGEITIAKSLFGGNKIGEEKHGKFMLELENLGNKRDVIHIEALDQRKICDAIPPLPKGDWLEKLKIKGIILPQDNFKGQEIDILIGANYLGMILTGKIVQVEADLTAVETKLGWTLMGNSPIIDSNDNVQQILNLLTTRCDLKDLWDLEVLGIRDPVETCSKETRYQEIKEKFITKIQRQSDQRYSVGLPWKVEKESIPSNLDIAIKRLDISTKKMTSQNKLTEYSQIFRDWLTEGLIERVEENPLERRGYYLPHRPVYKMESKTTPIRPVFDASCLGHNGLSLNQCLEKGPNLLERIPEIMIRFRENKFEVTADIRKAFQMVAIEESERNYLRFLWWEKESDRELIAYRHKRLVFGLNCSPFVLNAVIEYHLQSIRGPLVQWAKNLAQSFYMDNCITSLETKQEVQEFQKAAIEIMDRAKMDLREWEYSLEENPEKGTCTKILGVVWNKMEDSLKCELPDNLSIQPKLTKRLVLSMVQRIFDPLGFCAPVFLPPKLLLQRSWGLKLGWDTPLPESMAQEFRTWLDQIKLIELIKIPRYMWNDLIFPTEVHIFCDASQIGYGAVAYLRSETGRENTLTLIWSKVGLAPMKSITIPRLELMAMVLGARLANAIQAALKRKCETTLWSDSTTALSWIKKEIEWRVFVRNRVREIQATTNLNDWRFVPSQLNPADLLSRGCPPSQFVQSRWWEGPEWLKKPKEFWPNSEFSINPKEIKVEENIMKTNINLNIDYKDWLLTRRSNYSLNIRVPEEFKTPIILPGDHPFVEQLIWEVHLKNGHVGVQFILSKLREKFWIIRGRKTIKKIISKCIACKRLKEKSLQRPMAALPENRIGLGKPFQITGVDLLGPLHLKEGGKVWVAAFTCAVYRAIHLELVKSLETGVFMMALHRFICRRGRPEKIYSDNGTNFAKLNRIFKRLDWIRIERETSIERIQWIFIPPSAPWWGGFWERMVRTIKEMLIKMLGHRKLKYVQLQTALCEIESIINNRPLTYVSEDDNDLKPLTPNEFLQNGPESSFPEFENLKPEMLHTRYRELGQLKRELKQRFLKEYLGALVQKSENIDRRQFKVGDVVLIGQENLKRMFWPKGRIVNLIPGKDGIVRVAHVKTSTGTLIRALQRLHPLEISSNVETIQMDNSNTEPQSEAFLGNRPNIESRDSRNRYGRVIRKPA
ncbi:hypothetical protein LAZ67_5002202, partial [Cordylochernes scorpioides]